MMVSVVTKGVLTLLGTVLPPLGDVVGIAL